MINKLVFLFFCLSSMLMVEFKANATHYMGADLSYKCLTNDTVEFTLKIYRDCSGTTPLSSYPINVEAPSCGLFTSFNVDQVGVETEVSPLCPAQISQSTCNPGGTLRVFNNGFIKGELF